MKVLHVNNVDLLGNRFNGHDMQIELNRRGIEAHQVVMDRMGDDPHTLLIPGAKDASIRYLVKETEETLSIHGLLYPYLFQLMDMIEYKKADIVHYHLLHNHFGSFPVFSEMTHKKPSVLTVHDPWIFTGHCIYPEKCSKWLTGCGNCSNLDTNFPMKRDRTAFQWKIKEQVFKTAQVDLIVASKYMEKMIKASPITKHIKNVHLIPFGIDVDLFCPSQDKKTIRKRFDIPEHNFTLSFRSDPSPFKGFPTITKMLDLMKPDKTISLIAVGNPGMLDKYRNKFQVIDLGWLTDNSKMADVYAASDVFLMPSSAEAFGLMAIEAMASSIPVIVCDGTSLPDVTFAPECGIVIPQNDANILLQTIERLRMHPEEIQYRGKLGRKKAEEHYRFSDYVDNHFKLYEEIIRRGDHK